MTSLSRVILLVVLAFASVGCIARARGPAYVEGGVYSRGYVETYPGYYRRAPPRAHYYAPPPRVYRRGYVAPRAYVPRHDHHHRDYRRDDRRHHHHH
jgi:hypothetical protein